MLLCAVPLPRVGLSPPNKVPSPPNRNMKHYNSLEILSNIKYQPPRNKQSPWTPLVKTSWRRFWLCACAYGVKSEISLDTGDSASNAVVKRSVFINQRCAECVCLYTMDFVSAGKNTLLLLLYVTVCEKLYHGWISTMTSLNEISLISPPSEMKSWLRPWYQMKVDNWAYQEYVKV